MKLKLETQETTTILIVTETIEPLHLPILKAGLTKLFQSGKKSILLDFGQVTEKEFKDPTLFSQLAELRQWAAASEAQLVLVSPIESLGNAKTRAEGIQLLVSPLGQLQGIEATLQVKLKALEQQKASLTQKLGQFGKDADLKQLRLQNSRLKKNLSEAEKIATLFSGFRKKSPFKLPAVEATEASLHSLLDSFLKQEGLLT